ncbi:MAG: Pyridoxamine 5'-phosphate oxidase [Deltaproteobacteria bacterium ADurb.Bin510]|nr:MAG: Pyridoxamine 5'-phosphate oxidase [Deltaproteobacteria bacterium ADurb.Bin510]
MQAVIDFLNANPSGFMATLEGDQPRVRPFLFLKAEAGRFYWCTGRGKPVWEQLQANPHVEFSSSNAEPVWVRISGQVEFCGDQAVKQTIFESLPPYVQAIYQSADNPVFEVIYLEHGQASLSDFSGQPARVFEF